MPRGQKPKPTVLRKLAGNPGKRAYNDREPEPPPMADADTPSELADDAIAVREWRRLAPMLRRAKQITEADRGALIALCVEWSRYVTAKRNSYPAVSDGGKHNPWIGIQRHALQACCKLWPELGLTPSSRTRVKISESPIPGGDAFSEFDRDVEAEPEPDGGDDIPPGTTH